MRFRCCCTCDDGEKKKPVENNDINAQSSPASTSVPPVVITQQPKQKHEEPIPLDRRTPDVVPAESSNYANKEPELPIREIIKEELSTRPSSVRETERQELPTSVPTEDTPSALPPKSSNIDIDEYYDKLLKILLAKKAAEDAERAYIAPVTQSTTAVSSNSDFNVETTIGDEKLTFAQISPGICRGIFKGSEFYIINGEILDYNSVFSETEKEATNTVYGRVMENLQIGMKRLADGMSSSSSPATINTNYTTRNGKNGIMTFIPIGEGKFRSSYEGREFIIANGRILTTGVFFDDQDKELILRTYNNTLIGMQQGISGMHQGMLGMQQSMLGLQSSAIGGSAFAAAGQGGTAISGVSIRGSSAQATAYASAGVGRTPVAAISMDGIVSANASYNVLATSRDSFKTMRSSKHGKRISLLEGGLMAQPPKPVMVIEDITEKSKNSYDFDDIDGIESPEPVLQKTTFNPQAIIYEDPKTFEKQDDNELPIAKRLDEYIISMDENFNSANRFHFHEARPRRVVRKKLHPKEQFRLASPERYILFEQECLRLHNEYRRIHGVPPLVHNEFLSQVAKEWAEHLALKDDFYHRPNNEYGENLYSTHGMPTCAKMAVKAWYDEIDLYDYDNPTFSKEVGHFTQLVWKDTREIGTGVAQIGNKVWVCCNYHPPGNHGDKFNDEFVPRPLIKRVKRN